MNWIATGMGIVIFAATGRVVPLLVSFVASGYGGYLGRHDAEA